LHTFLSAVEWTDKGGNKQPPRGIKYELVTNWATGTHRIPPYFLDPIAGHFYGWLDKPLGRLTEEARQFATDLQNALQADADSAGDLWIKSDHFLRQLKIAKLEFPPFCGPGDGGVPFIDFLVGRFQRFCGHKLELTQRADLGQVLGQMADTGRNVKVSFGVLSSLDRLTALRAILLPPRVGLNAVVLDGSSQDVTELQKALVTPGKLNPGKFIPVVLKHEVGYTHLVGLGVPHKVLEAYSVDYLRPQEYARKLLRIREQYAKRLIHGRDRADMRICPLAVADEVTCLAMLKYLRRDHATADMVFPLATGQSVLTDKTELPEFMMSILVNREEERIFNYIRDAFWQILQTDVQLLTREYVGLYRSLEVFAGECLPEEYENRSNICREWAKYTLRLDPDFLELYTDRDLPWKPILNRAMKVLQGDVTFSPKR
jgi:hypothetical protein